MAGALIVNESANDSLNPPGYVVEESIMVLRIGSGGAIPALEGTPESVAKTLGDIRQLIDLDSERDLHLLINEMDADRLEQMAQALKNLRQEPPTFTVNGDTKPVSRIRTDQVQRLRLINAGSRDGDYKDLWVEGHDMYLAAVDGINLTHLPKDANGNYISYNQDNKLQLAPGNRADVFFIPEDGVGEFSLMMTATIGIEALGGSPTDISTERGRRWPRALRAARDELWFDRITAFTRRAG